MNSSTPRTPRRRSSSSNKYSRRIPESLMEMKRDSISRKYNIGALATPSRKTTENEERSSIVATSNANIPSFCTPSRKRIVADSFVQLRRQGGGRGSDDNKSDDDELPPVVMPANLDDSLNDAPGGCSPTTSPRGGALHRLQARRSASFGNTRKNTPSPRQRNSLQSRRRRTLASRSSAIVNSRTSMLSPRRSLSATSPSSRSRNQLDPRRSEASSFLPSPSNSYRWENVSIDDDTLSAKRDDKKDGDDDENNNKRHTNRLTRGGQRTKSSGRISLSPKGSNINSPLQPVSSRKFRAPKKNGTFEKGCCVKSVKSDKPKPPPVGSVVLTRPTDADLSSVTISLDDTSMGHSCLVGGGVKKEQPQLMQQEQEKIKDEGMMVASGAAIAVAVPVIASSSSNVETAAAAPTTELERKKREPTTTWLCNCGYSSSKTKRFCGMCGNSQKWICGSCGDENNLALYCFCAMCGVPKTSSTTTATSCQTASAPMAKASSVV